MEFMDVSEETSDTLSGRFDNLSVIHTKVTKLDTDNKVCRVNIILVIIIISTRIHS
mgnify:CR=1